MHNLARASYILGWTLDSLPLQCDRNGLPRVVVKAWRSGIIRIFVKPTNHNGCFLSNQNPQYSLESLCAAAKAGKLSLLGRSQVESAELGYSDEDVADCICRLTAEDFVKTDEYQLANSKKSVKCDVYHVTCDSPAGQPDELYIKLRLSTWALVVSFHLRRY